MKLYYATKANTSPRGKDYIFVHAMPEDRGLADQIISLIMEDDDGQQYACWQADDPEKVFSNYAQPEIAGMQLYLPIITRAYLDAANQYPDFKMESISAQGLFVLPLLESPDLIPAFTNRFGELHVITINRNDLKTELKKQFDRFLAGSELKDSIRKDAFTAQLFLSYRKKDFHDAMRILKAIHDTEWGKYAQIWYDDFIVPGKDFNQEITEAMEQSETVVLSVTPNLLEIHPDGTPNYVLAHEYPDARKAGKPVVPVEAVNVQRSLIAEAYPGIPEFVPVDNGSAIESALKASTGSDCGDEIEREQNPYLFYLLGEAFLMGFRVEKDVPRALKHLKKAADLEVVEAAEQLFLLYVYGYEVSRDIQKATKWKVRAFEIMKNRPSTDETISRMRRILFDDGLAGLLANNDRLEESNQYCQELVDAVDAFDPDDESEMILWKAEALLNLGDIDHGLPCRNRSYANNLEYMYHMTELAASCLEDYYGDENAYFFKLKALIGDSYAAYYRNRNDENKACIFAMMAVKNMKESLAKESSYESLSLMAKLQGNLSGSRYLLSGKPGLTSVMRANYLTDAVIATEEAIKINTQLYEIRKMPGVADALALSYLNKSLILKEQKEKEEAQKALKQGLEVIRMLESDYPGEGQATKMKLQSARI